MITTNFHNTQKRRFSWKCPKCKRKNRWMWDLSDFPDLHEIMILACDHCGKKSVMKCKMVEIKDKQIAEDMIRRLDA